MQKVIDFIHAKVYYIKRKEQQSKGDKTMTNEMIILTESVRLMEEGVLKATGRKLVTEDGKEIDEPEAIHTFNGWKERGYQVRKGQKSAIKFPIWKHTSKKVVEKAKDGSESETEHERMFMKMSAFFTLEQCEPIKQ